MMASRNTHRDRPLQVCQSHARVELVLEAYEGYWRKVPNLKRIVIKGVPEATTRLAMLKRGEADIAVALQGAIAEEVQRDPNSSSSTRDIRPSFGWNLPSSGIRSRCGPTFACGKPSIMPSIAKPSIRQPVGLLPASRRHRPTPDGLCPAGRASAV